MDDGEGELEGRGGVADDERVKILLLHHVPIPMLVTMAHYFVHESRPPPAMAFWLPAVGVEHTVHVLAAHAPWRSATLHPPLHSVRVLARRTGGVAGLPQRVCRRAQ